MSFGFTEHLARVAVGRHHLDGGASVVLRHPGAVWMGYLLEHGLYRGEGGLHSHPPNSPGLHLDNRANSHPTSLAEIGYERHRGL